MLRPDEEPWYFYGQPLQLSSLELPGLDETHAPRYNQILQLPSIISRSSDNVLQILWEFPEDDLSDALVRKFILASVGVGRSPEAQAQAEQIYDEVRTHLFGPCGIIRGTTVLSCFQRILRHQIVRDTEIHDFRALGIQNASLPLHQPDFIFYAKLVPRDGYEPIESLSRYYSWFTLIYPRQGIGFAFAEGNWCTLGAFREVVDALLGRHVAAGPPAAPISIFTDPGCTVVALDESSLSGDFYFQLTTTVLGDTPLFSDEPVLPKDDFCFSQYSDLPRRETFANRVDYRCAHKCALSKAAELGEPDTEAAYIIPRCAHKAFPRLLQKILPSTNVQSIDHPANGINLWLAVHRAWDGHRAALSPSPRNIAIFSERRYPLDLLQLESLSPYAVESIKYGSALTALLQLRFTLTMIEWFAGQDLRSLLGDLGRKDSSAAGSSGTTTPTAFMGPKKASEALPGATEGAVMVGGGAFTEDWEEKEEEEVEVGNFHDFPHEEGCSCDLLDVDGKKVNDGPCVLPLLGAVRLWEAIGSIAPSLL